ncbi:hypothetical protein L596_000475 [Steinernema carpocapsae]|uniref:Uncharacterized protein n=1 Tax=Steinernema carpocapsae TaxID=34508 RepID=A0A4V6I744_STECR|nr:hypothetical protein L596_000475 [Steinernema carpocapsae]
MGLPTSIDAILGVMEMERAALVVLRANISVHLTAVEEKMMTAADGNGPSSKLRKRHDLGEPEAKRRRRSPECHGPRIDSVPRCLLCPMNHEAQGCTTYKTVRARWRRLRATNKCKFCLYVHGAHELCESGTWKDCGGCGGDDHHEALCRTRENQEKAAGSIVGVSDENESS